MMLRGTVFSKILHMHTGITVATPADYSRGAPYKTVYLLHGMGANHASWADYTMLPAFVDKYRLAVVMPGAGRSFYTDTHYGRKVFSYIADELPHICETVFNISAAPGDTAVIGASMGGYGALKCALSRPGRCGFCGAISTGGLFLEETLAGIKTPAGAKKLAQDWGDQLVLDFAAAFGPDYAYNPKDDALELAKLAQNAPAKPRIYAVCGLGDPLLGFNRRFAAAMQPLPYHYTYEEWEGGHDWEFFNEALRKMLQHFAEG